uniref:G-protein coupled receptors family 1 profile domain-containing protein n=1 Tax=Gopherus agassizii TaxID=38772 RepID=A0A452IG29_9SAUR
MYCFHGLAVTESLLLVVMFYDRYEAICNPLHYPVKMTKRVIIQLAACAWITALLIPIPVVFQTSHCDHLAVVQAACSDFSASLKNFLGFSIAMTVSFVPLMLAFSTCTSHLIVVGTYYSSIAVAYISYRKDMPVDIHVMSNVVFAILTPLLNPLIYTLRNKEVKLHMYCKICYSENICTVNSDFIKRYHGSLSFGDSGLNLFHLQMERVFSFS